MAFPKEEERDHDSSISRYTNCKSVSEGGEVDLPKPTLDHQRFQPLLRTTPYSTKSTIPLDEELPKCSYMYFYDEEKSEESERQKAKTSVSLLKGYKCITSNQLQAVWWIIMCWCIIVIGGHPTNHVTRTSVQQRGRASLGRNLLLECLTDPHVHDQIGGKFFKNGKDARCSMNDNTVKFPFCLIENFNKSDEGTYQCDFRAENDTSHHDMKTTYIRPSAVGSESKPSLQMYLDNSMCNKTVCFTETGSHNVSCQAEWQGKEFIGRSLTLTNGTTVLAYCPGLRCSAELVVYRAQEITCEAELWDIVEQREVLPIQKFDIRLRPHRESQCHLETCLIILSVILAVLCVVCIIGGYLCGRRASNGGRRNSQSSTPADYPNQEGYTLCSFHEEMQCQSRTR